MKQFTEKNLAREIRLLGKSREQVAKKIGVTVTTLSNWINGRYPISPEGVTGLRELGVTQQALDDPEKIIK